MFKKVDLMRYCSFERYNNLKRMYMQGVVEDLSYNDSNYPIISIHGDVFTSEIEVDYVSANVEIDYEHSRITRGGCNCRYIKQYNKVCDHILILIYAFLDEVEMGLIEIGQKNRRTDFEILDAIKEFSGTENVLEYKQSDKSGTVYIKPEIQMSENNMDSMGESYVQVSFSIGKGNGKSYVIKNISDFEDALINEKEYTLGKSLSINLCMESFDNVSLPIAKFLLSLPSAGDAYVGKGRYYYNYYNGPTNLDAGRELTLTGKYLDNFMRACEASGVLVFDKDNGSRKNARLYNIVDGKPNIQTSITKVDGGYEVELEEKQFFNGKKYIYTMDDENGLIVRSICPKNTVQLFHALRKTYRKEKSFVADKDIKAFTHAIYPQLENNTYLKKVDYLPENYELPKPEFEIYLDMPQESVITAELYAIYGDKKYNALEYSKKDLAQRNDLEEKKMDKYMSQFFNSFDSNNFKWAILNDEDKIYVLLTGGISELQKKAKVFVSDALKKLTVKKMDKVSVGVSVQSDLLQLSLNTDQRTLDDLAEILSRYTPKKKYYRLKNGDFIVIDEESLESLNRLTEELQLSNKDIRKGNIKIPKYRALYLEKMSETSDLVLNRDEYFDSLIQNISDVNQKEYEIPTSIHAELREYQKEGYKWLRRLQENGFAGLLADEMGLGKTLQVITFMASLNDNKRKLVVTPASLVYNWASEIERFAPDLEYHIVSGLPELRKRTILDSSEDSILITSYDSLKRDFEYYEGMKFSVEVIDEAQFIKNANTQASQAVKEINSSFRIALTGTPIENRLSELWSIFDYLLPGFLYRYRIFKSYFESPIVKEGDKELEERLRNMISPFILRRYKKDVLKDLPEKLEEVYYAPLEDEQKELYDARVQRMKIMLAKESNEDFNKSKIAVLAELTRLRQICCSPDLVYEGYKGNSNKEDLCMELIHTAIEGGHKILLFSQFTSMLEKLNKRLEEEGISYYYLHGGTDKKERQRLVDKFQEDDTSVFCISLKAGGTGLNLTAADIVIHYDPWWNTAVENQATDRTHRIGQDKVVTVYKLIMKDTVEERIIELQSSKADLAKEMLSGEEMGSTSFTREQLLDILN